MKYVNSYLESFAPGKYKSIVVTSCLIRNWNLYCLQSIFSTDEINAIWNWTRIEAKSAKFRKRWSTRLATQICACAINWICVASLSWLISGRTFRFKLTFRILGSSHSSVRAPTLWHAEAIVSMFSPIIYFISINKYKTVNRI